MGVSEEMAHVGAHVGRREVTLESGHELLHGGGAVAALQHLGGARVELDHAFRVQQDPRLLRGLELEAVHLRDGGTVVERQASWPPTALCAGPPGGERAPWER